MNIRMNYREYSKKKREYSESNPEYSRFQLYQLIPEGLDIFQEFPVEEE